MLVDTHTHLYFDAFDADREAVLERAAGAGVDGLVHVGIDPAGWERVLELAGRPGDAAVIGLHPHHAEQADEELYDLLRRLAVRPEVAAIGEIGLDWHYPEPPREVQERAFRRQIRLARELGLPIVIHNREADADILRVLEEEKGPELRGIFHCFSGEVETAERCLDLGFYIGMGGIVTFKNGHRAQEVARRLPLDRLVLETDSPFLAPHPYRGRRNEPAYVRLVAEKVAELKGLSVEEVAAATTENARRILGLRGSRGGDGLDIESR